MSPKTWSMDVSSGLLIGNIWFNIATAGEHAGACQEECVGIHRVGNRGLSIG